MKLIDAIMVQAQCKDKHKLVDLSEEKKQRLARLVEERVPSGLATLEEWNEVILCFENTELEISCKRAKKRLLSILRSENRRINK